MKRDLSDDQLNQPVTLTLPLRAVLRLADDPAQSAHIGVARGLDGSTEIFTHAIPKLLDGEAYAGILLRDGVPQHHLILLPGDEKMPWAAARKWASERGGELPTRKEQALLFANCGALFQGEWYWSSEEYAGNADYAWTQGFGYGNQGNARKDNSYRCRAVRRVAI